VRRPAASLTTLADVLTLPQALLDQVLAHARRDHPDECCGVIAGKDGTASRVIPMENAERSPTGFAFGSGEWLRVYRDVDDADEDLLAVYHSHTATEAYPSRTDVLWAQHNEFAHWLLVSTRAEEDEVRSYTITDGVVAEEPVEIV